MSTMRVTITHDDGSLGEYDVERVVVETFKDEPVSVRGDFGSIIIEPLNRDTEKEAS